MNTAFSILSAAAASEEAQGVIDRMNSYVATADKTIAQQQIADPDYWGSVGILTITGILVVFFILAILIFIFWLMGTVFKSIDQKKKNKVQAAKAAEPAPAAAPVEEAAEDEAEDVDEIMAVISAAIAAYSEQDGKNYTIKNVRRKDGRARSAWSLAGIGDNTHPF